MRVFVILAVIVFGALVVGRYLDGYFGWEDGIVNAFVVGPVLFFGGLWAAFRAYKNMRQRRRNAEAYGDDGHGDGPHVCDLVFALGAEFRALDRLAGLGRVHSALDARLPGGYSCIRSAAVSRRRKQRSPLEEKVRKR